MARKMYQKERINFSEELLRTPTSPWDVEYGEGGRPISVGHSATSKRWILDSEKDPATGCYAGRMQ